MNNEVRIRGEAGRFGPLQLKGERSFSGSRGQDAQIDGLVNDIFAEEEKSFEYFWGHPRHVPMKDGVGTRSEVGEDNAQLSRYKVNGDCTLSFNPGDPVPASMDLVTGNDNVSKHIRWDGDHIQSVIEERLLSDGRREMLSIQEDRTRGTLTYLQHVEPAVPGTFHGIPRVVDEDL